MALKARFLSSWWLIISLIQMTTVSVVAVERNTSRTIRKGTTELSKIEIRYFNGRCIALLLCIIMILITHIMKRNKCNANTSSNKGKIEMNQSINNHNNNINNVNHHVILIQCQIKLC